MNRLFVMLDELDTESQQFVDSEVQIAEVKKSMGELGIERLPVYCGEAPDTIKTSLAITS